MRTRANALRAERLKELEPGVKVDTRPFDKAEDKAWRGLYNRLDACVDAGVAGAPEAAQLLDSEFEDGLVFLTLTYPEQFKVSAFRSFRGHGRPPDP
jgi:hypothetical protein